EMLRNLQRQRLDRDLADDLRGDAALGDADRLADQLDHDPRLDRLVEAHLLEVDVRESALHRVLLVLLEDRRARGVLAVEGDVEDRVQDRKSTRLNSSHLGIPYAVFCLKK